MSLEGIKSELAKMSKEDQDHLAAFLVHLRHQRDLREMTAAIDDSNAENWITVGRLKDEWKD